MATKLLDFLHKMNQSNPHYGTTPVLEGTFPRSTPFALIILRYFVFSAAGISFLFFFALRDAIWLIRYRHFF